MTTIRTNIYLIHDLAAGKFTIKELAAKYNLPYQKIYKYCVRNSIQFVKQNAAPLESYPELIKDMKTGLYTAEDLSHKHGVLAQSIRSWAFRNDIKLAAAHMGRPVSFDLEFFRKPHAATWWLMGYFAADVNVSPYNAVLEISCLDAGALYDIKDLLQLKSDIHYRIRVKKWTEKVFLHARIELCSIELVGILARYNLVPAKSLTLKYPNLCDEAQAHFIRGYGDGDGTINLSTKDAQVSFAGTEEFLRSMMGVIQKLAKITGGGLYKVKDHNIWNLLYCGNLQCCQLLDWMYSDSQPKTRLNRKFLKYQTLSRSRL